MRNLILILLLFIQLILSSCAFKPKLTDKHILKNQQLVYEVTQYMKSNKIDTLSKENCTVTIKRKLGILKTPRVLCCRSKTFYLYPDEITVKDTLFEFYHYGSILGYNEVLLLIPPKTSDALKLILPKLRYKKINDAIYTDYTPALPLM